MKNFVMVITSVPAKSVDKIINYILKNKLVACVNRVRNVNSFYWWENKICKDKEDLLLIKTKKTLVNKIIEEIKKIHPYKIPEIISFEIYKANKEYLKWIKEITTK
ncbi:MAG: divalent-cation tolerance protein CutA [Endomicrobiia bacterium]